MAAPCEMGTFNPERKDPSQRVTLHPVDGDVAVSTLDHALGIIQTFRGSPVNPDLKGFLFVPQFNTEGVVVGETSMPVSERTLRRQIDEADEAGASMVFVRKTSNEKTPLTQSSQK